MGTSEQVVGELNRRMQEQERSVAWLARNSGLPYKRLLAEMRHRTRPVSLEAALTVAPLLGTTLPELVGDAA